MVFLLGTDLFDLDARGRATFYVGATRAKVLLYITGVADDEQHSLLDEALSVNEVI